MNVALYGPNNRAWFALTERALSDSREERHRGRDFIRIGPSEMAWRSRDDLVLSIDERTAPGPFARGGAPIRGTVRLVRESEPSKSQELAPGHQWQAIAPLAAIEVSLEEPDVHFRGHGYHDANCGASPLESAFSAWRWSRARLNERRRASVIYDTIDHDGNAHQRALLIDRDGALDEDHDLFGAHPTSPLPRTTWGLGRSTRLDDHGHARLLRDLEDGPFYARSLLGAQVCGEDVIAMHEEMSCRRLAQRWVRFLVGFRMARERQRWGLGVPQKGLHARGVLAK